VGPKKAALTGNLFFTCGLSFFAVALSDLANNTRSSTEEDLHLPNDASFWNSPGWLLMFRLSAYLLGIAAPLLIMAPQLALRLLFPHAFGDTSATLVVGCYDGSTVMFLLTALHAKGVPKSTREQTISEKFIRETPDQDDHSSRVAKALSLSMWIYAVVAFLNIFIVMVLFPGSPEEVQEASEKRKKRILETEYAIEDSSGGTGAATGTDAGAVAALTNAPATAHQHQHQQRSSSSSSSSVPRAVTEEQNQEVVLICEPEDDTTTTGAGAAKNPSSSTEAAEKDTKQKVCFCLPQPAWLHVPPPVLLPNGVEPASLEDAPKDSLVYPFRKRCEKMNLFWTVLDRDFMFHSLFFALNFSTFMMHLRAERAFLGDTDMILSNVLSVMGVPMGFLAGAWFGFFGQRKEYAVPITAIVSIVFELLSAELGLSFYDNVNTGVKGFILTLKSLFRSMLFTTPWTVLPGLLPGTRHLASLYGVGLLLSLGTNWVIIDSGWFMSHEVGDDSEKRSELARNFRLWAYVHIAFNICYTGYVILTENLRRRNVRDYNLSMLEKVERRLAKQKMKITNPSRSTRH